jgi:hypothetical protein
MIQRGTAAALSDFSAVAAYGCIAMTGLQMLHVKHAGS